jgi:hypothetical protein
VATLLSIAQHPGYNRAVDECEDGAVSALYLSEVQPGLYFPSPVPFVATPRSPTGPASRITETGLWGLSPQEAIKRTRWHVTRPKVAETMQRSHTNRDVVIEALRRSRG